MYEYRARATRVVDGDTFDLVIDLGFRLTATLRIRLLGCNAFELNSQDEVERAKAIQAKAFAEEALMSDERWPLRINTEKTDSFGRWLADVAYSGPETEVMMKNLTVELLSRGLAVPYRRS